MPRHAAHFLLPFSAWGVQVLLEACKFLAIVITLDAGVKGVKSLLIGLNDHAYGKPAAQLDLPLMLTLARN
jgi:hypothetical protein